MGIELGEVFFLLTVTVWVWFGQGGMSGMVEPNQLVAFDTNPCFFIAVEFLVGRFEHGSQLLLAASKTGENVNAGWAEFLGVGVGGDVSI